MYQGPLSRGHSEFVDCDSPPASPPSKKRKVETTVIPSQSDADYEDEMDDTPQAPLQSGIQLGDS